MDEPTTRDAFTGPSFSLTNRFVRVIWNIVAAIFFRCSPRPCHAWRASLLRLFGARIGRGARIYAGASVWAPWNLEVGDESVIADGVIVYSQGKITVGRRSVISQGTHICSGTHDYTDPGFPLITRPIVIGDHVWVAAEAFIHPGVTIHDGVVVSARSVVLKDLPEWHVCSGFPCVPLKTRERTNFNNPNNPNAQPHAAST